MNVLLSLDLSTNSTGYAKFNIDTGELLSFGVIKPDHKNPKKKGIPELFYPQLHILKLRRLADQVLELLDADVKMVFCEEINRGKNRIGQKVLDSFHAILLERMPWDFAKMVRFVDSDGRDGWRSATGLKLQLSLGDKESNKAAKKFNKRLGRKEKKYPIITQKTLACRFVNRMYNLRLDSDEVSTDGDAADAIGLGTFVLTKILEKSHA